MQWRKFTLNTTTEATDFVIGMLAENGIDSFEIEDRKPLSEEDKKAMFVDILPDPQDDDGRARIIFYMDSDVAEEEVGHTLQGIQAGLEELRNFTEVGEGTIEESSTEDKDWVNNWKQFFKPFSVDDILIKPTWESVDNPEDYKMVIEIDPGTAFGTGLHETTQLCIRQLRKYITADSRLLDIGCGSGILTIIGRKLGAFEASGIDIDEAAVKASVENAEVNRVTERIAFFEGNILEDKELQERAGYDCYDIVTANILADVIIPLSRIVAPHLKVGGLFITSGIIDTREADVVAAIRENPMLELKEITRQKDWVNVTAVRVR
ncbi:MAG: 50S ribosomal protein L11 methyltransferase [Lachnospiraceae bacterium]|nr:50S ribosomal protein L11 methyltransferase [Lachnospiraceae bacterium]